MIATTTRKGLIVAAFHMLIVASLGAKLLVDRATRPRVWARAAPVDPSMPIRGRYVQLGIEAERPAELARETRDFVPVKLAVKDHTLTVMPATTRGLYARPSRRGDSRVIVLMPPVAYFIPEHAADPSIRRPGEELWVEVTVPRAGGPRPIRLGVMKNGVLSPLP